MVLILFFVALFKNKEIDMNSSMKQKIENNLQKEKIDFEHMKSIDLIFTKNQINVKCKQSSL